jgi:alanyl aminopeptidase
VSPEYRILAAAALAAVSVPVAARAVRLDTRVVPTFQYVSLHIDAGQKDYTGSTRIELQVKEKTASFRFHAEDIPLTRLVLTGPKGPIAVEHESGDGATIEVRAKSPLAPGKYTLEIDFANGFGTQAVGLYRMENEGQGYVFTQFEADDAREAFPCWDEPGFKIPWQLAVDVPEGHIAVTNTPVESERVENGWRKYVFRRTQPLPSYLIAVAAGPLERVPIQGMSVPGNVVTLRGQSRLAKLAAELTPPILKGLEAYFGQPYPFEKLDLIGIPEYWAGAMENPGAITYAASILLVDPDAASVGQRSSLARVTAHELSHMWFGDMVTMKWWDDLWLNESFADWMGDKITDQVHPQFDVGVEELQNVSRVMAGDARPSAQAIRRPVESTDDLLQNVGTQYNKGKAVLGMFEQWIGEEKFRAGVLAYLREHQWGSTTASDFWQALSKASGTDVSAAMATFIEQPGLPLVRVEPESGNRVKISQRRFSNWGVQQPEQSWKVPVALRYSDGKAVHTQSLLLDTPSRVVTLETPGAPEWLLPNADQRGYYFWESPPEMVALLASRSAEILNERERAGFLGNLSALLDAGVVHGDAYLAAVGQFTADKDPQIISTALGALQKVRMAFVPPELEATFGQYVRTSLRPALDRFGMDARPGEPEGITLVRPELLAWLGDAGQDAEIRAHGEKLARAYLDKPTSIDPSVASTALQLAAIRGDRALFDLYCQRFESSQVPADRNRFLAGLGGFRDPQVVEAALGYTLKGPLRPNECFRIPFALLSHPESRDHVFEWFLANYGAMAQRLPPPARSFMPFVASGCSAERLAAAQEFFSKPEHQGPGIDVTLAKVSDQVHDCVGLREREGPAVAAFLEKKFSSARNSK